MTGCVGWNYHVFSLGSDRCSMCNKTKEQIEAEVRKGTK